MTDEELRAYHAAHSRKHYWANREKRWAYMKKYRAENREKIQARRAAYREENRERLNEEQRREYWAEVEKHRRWASEWAKKNRDYYTTLQRNRRARLRGSTDSFTAADVSRIKLAQGGKCGYCRQRLRKTETHIDHITPVAKGGSNSSRNIQLLCRLCNQSKGSKDPIDFARQRGMLA